MPKNKPDNYDRKILNTGNETVDFVFTEAEEPTPDVDFKVGYPYVGTSGDLEVVMASSKDGTSVIIKDIAAGIIHPIKIKQIKSAGTGALDILIFRG